MSKFCCCIEVEIFQACLSCKRQKCVVCEIVSWNWNKLYGYKRQKDLINFGRYQTKNDNWDLDKVGVKYEKLIDQIFSVIYEHIVVKIEGILTNAVSKSSAKLQLTAKVGILIVALNSYLIAVVKMLYKSTSSLGHP